MRPGFVIARKSLSLPAVEPADESLCGIANCEEEAVLARHLAQADVMRMEKNGVTPAVHIRLERCLDCRSTRLPEMKEMCAIRALSGFAPHVNLPIRG